MYSMYSNRYRLRRSCFYCSHTATATVAAIERTGANPVLVDIDPQTYTIDPDHLEGAVRSQIENNPSQLPKAIISVHLYGHPSNMPTNADVA